MIQQFDVCGLYGIDMMLDVNEKKQGVNGTNQYDMEEDIFARANSGSQYERDCLSVFELIHGYVLGLRVLIEDGHITGCYREQERRC